MQSQYKCKGSTYAHTTAALMHVQLQQPQTGNHSMHLQSQCLCICNCSARASAITACRCNHSTQVRAGTAPTPAFPFTKPHAAAPRAGTQLPPSPLHTQSPDTQAYFYCICQEHEKPFCQHSARAIYEPGLSEEGVGIREEMMGEKMAHKLFAMIYTVVHLQPILFLEPHTQISLSALLHFGVLSRPSWRKAAIRVQLVQTELK